MIGAQFSRKVFAETPSSSICCRSLRSIGGNQENHFRARPESRGSDLLDSAQLDEEKLFREREIFLQNSIAGERAPRIRQHALRRRGIPSARSALAGRAAKAAFFDGRSGSRTKIRMQLLNNKLIQRVDQIAFAIEIKAQRAQV